jgi:hypothetical protein
MVNLFSEVFKGLLIAILYFEITKTNDTTFENIILFVAFYLSMILGATLAKIDTNVITGAFLTKTVFTLIDERIKRDDNKKD